MVYLQAADATVSGGYRSRLALLLTTRTADVTARQIEAGWPLPARGKVKKELDGTYQPVSSDPSYLNSNGTTSPKPIGMGQSGIPIS
ncbi:hypothetical protein FPOAC2_08110 [Fusarium poae]|jgi:hypothetical protein